MKRLLAWLTLAMAGVFVADHARAADINLSEITDESGLAVVLVSGVHSGPALWQVRSGDNVLWILGEISPFPRQVRWKSTEFERLLRKSQELLLDYSGYWWLDDDTSSALTKASKLPEGQTLRDVIAPDLHAQVTAVAARFGNPSLEGLRPFAATNRLVTSAMKTLNLSSFSVRFTAARLGEWRKRRITYFAAPELPFEERLRHWQQATNEVCLARLADVLRDGGQGVMELANAWAVGDIAALRELVPVYSFSRDGFRAGACADAMHGGPDRARAYQQQRIQAWVDQAERALRENRSTIAVVLMSELFQPEGYLAALRAKGYRIEEPARDR